MGLRLLVRDLQTTKTTLCRLAGKVPAKMCIPSHASITANSCTNGEVMRAKMIDRKSNRNDRWIKKPIMNQDEWDTDSATLGRPATNWRAEEELVVPEFRSRRRLPTTSATFNPLDGRERRLSYTQPARRHSRARPGSCSSRKPAI
ncbi:hypothetical protein LSAT2_000731 [Lamellibrachia satsuma]|nr:hypothetical protein LSAT2_000731 [Lamellibrachia satsuma]